jgi:hypothetical protein
MSASWPPLRIMVAALAGAQTVYWLYTVWIAATQNPMGDGMDTIPAFFSTPPFILFTAPALLLGLINRALKTAAVLALVGLALTPMVLWQVLFPETMWTLTELLLP